VHHRVDFKNSKRSPQIGKMPKDDRKSMMEKKRKMEKMARGMIPEEIATFTIGEYLSFVK
jgi:hypothetical protein